MPDDPMKAYHKVSCPCGAGVRVDVQNAERSLRCPKCMRLLDFVVSIDARSKRPRVSIVVSMDAMLQGGESLAFAEAPRKKGPPPPVEPPRTRVAPRTVRGVFGTCICGTSFPVDDRELTTIAPCPKCGIEYHVVVKIERGTKKKTAMLVPVKSEVARRPTISPAAPPPSATRSGKRTQAPVRARTKVAAPKAAPVEIPPGAQAVACSCGETLVVRRKDVVRGMLCPSCGRGLKFKEQIDPQTLAPRISIRD